MTETGVTWQAKRAETLDLLRRTGAGIQPGLSADEEHEFTRQCSNRGIPLPREYVEVLRETAGFLAGDATLLVVAGEEAVLGSGFEYRNQLLEHEQLVFYGLVESQALVYSPVADAYAFTYPEDVPLNAEMSPFVDAFVAFLDATTAFAHRLLDAGVIQLADR